MNRNTNLPLSPSQQEELLTQLGGLINTRKNIILAIEGRCGSGKTTLAAYLAGIYDCNVIHMDDFYLPFSMRTSKRLAEPGGNIHYERFLTEIYTPLRRLAAKETFTGNHLTGTAVDAVLGCYQVFSCVTGDYDDTYPLYNRPLTIIEGSYCMHPEFRNLYDLSVFLDITAELQLKRLRNRVGSEALNAFIEKWIPLENAYFDTGIAGICTKYYLQKEQWCL